MKNTMLCSIVAMLVIMIVSGYVGYEAGKNSAMRVPYQGEDVTTAEPEHDLPHNTRGSIPKYRLGEQDGRLAVYTAGKQTPDLVFDVYIKHLPPLDQAELREGIDIYSYSELTSRIEDYIS